MRAYRLIGAPRSAAFVHLRRYLRWKNVAFTEKVADRDVLAGEVKARMTHPVLPLLITPDNQTISNETAIVDAINARHAEPNLEPGTAAGLYANCLLEAFSVKWLSPAAQAISLATDRDSFTRDVSASVWSHSAAFDQGILAKRLVRQIEHRLVRTGFDPVNPLYTETALTEFLDALEYRLQRGSYLFGDHPKSADIALSAPISLMPSRTFVDLPARYTGIQRWLMNMMEPPGRRPSGERNPISLPDSVYPVIRFATRSFLTPARETVEALSDWVASHPGKINLPRTFGQSSPEGKHRRQTELTPDYYWLLQGLIDAASRETLPGEQAELNKLDSRNPISWKLERDVRYENHKFRVNPVANATDSGDQPVPLMFRALDRVVENSRQTRVLEALAAE